MSRGPGRWQRALIRETRPDPRRFRDWVGVRDIWVAVKRAELDAAGVPRFAWPEAEEEGLLHAWSPLHPERDRLHRGPIPRGDEVSIRRGMLGFVDAGVLEAKHFGGYLKVRWPHEEWRTALANLEKALPYTDPLSGTWNML